ncbi:MAG TPA: ribosome assembly cofactor RimP [Paludibacteraceae bacterium]|nr:ribosome assembly cofactor RimP [Paludibacteraceae bacterium]
MISEKTIHQLAEKFTENKDFYIVELKVNPDNQILIKFDSFKGVTIDDCVSLSEFIESNLDREIEDYELEVSSPGLTEPFKVLQQYEKNIGNEVEVLTKGGNKFSGKLLNATNNEFVVQIKKMKKLENSKRKTIVTENVIFHYDEIKTTKYILRFK